MKSEKFFEKYNGVSKTCAINNVNFHSKHTFAHLIWRSVNKTRTQQKIGHMYYIMASRCVFSWIFYEKCVVLGLHNLYFFSVFSL